MALVDTLKAQHLGIQVLVMEIGFALRRGDAEEVGAALAELKPLLIEHHALEDRELYAVLLAAGRSASHGRAAETARHFVDNMARLTEAMIAFLSRHDPRRLNLEKFATEFNGFTALLGSRAKAEEQTLYPLYERLLAKVPSPEPRTTA